MREPSGTAVAEIGGAGRTSPDDDVVLLDDRGRPAGRARKRDVHGTETPLHLAISCYVVRADGRLLITRRAAGKRTWPGVWTNACCGHPRPDEPLESAVRRHLHDELALTPTRLGLALPDFTYRASMADGCTEHELCPVFVAEVDREPELDPTEADAAEWVTWEELCGRARDDERLSPWSRTQIERLAALMDTPLAWVRARPVGGTTQGSMSRPPRPAIDPFAAMGDDVEALVASFVARAADDLVELDPLAAELAVPVRSLFASGGKRLRPCLVYCGYEAGAGAGAAGQGDRRDVAHLAAAVEMLHTFALLHDDVMDRSAERRGRPTAHVRFAEMHRERRSSGDSDWFGASAALVAGDLAFVWADQLLDRLACHPARLGRIRSVYGRLRTEVIAGQYLDLRHAGSWASDGQAQNVALLKSGRYTVTRPLELGALLGGAPDDMVDALRQFGDAIGVAFQLRDDVLGVFGDPSVTGKGAADDLRSGKASLLLVRAIELARPADRRVLRAHLGRHDLDAACLEECRAIVRATGALASIEALIAAKAVEADDALDRLPPRAAAPLAALSALLVERDA